MILVLVVFDDNVEATSCTITTITVRLPCFGETKI